ncbi:MAG: MarR family transcriptional regulator [Actinomycetota bacterium]|nr:MarR family transcriptional regulator [Actinomycetota bacterium]
MEMVTPLTTVCPSSDERVTLFALLLDTNARLSRSFAVRLEESCELPLAWFEVLLQLRRAPEGTLKMNEIAEAIVHSTGGTTRLIDRLEESGLVERQLCPTDRRAIHVAITPEGNLKLDEALHVHMDYLEEHLSSRLTCQERGELTVLLSKLNATR